MTRWLTVIVICAALALHSGEAYAQQATDFELNFFAAYTSFTGNDFVIGFPQTLTPVSGSFRFDEALRGGVRFSVYDRGHWSEEFFYSVGPNEANFSRGGILPAALDLPIQVHNYGVNTNFYFSDNEENNVRPFVSAGIGGTVYRPTGEALEIARDPFQGNLPELETSNEFAFNYGLGIKWRWGRYFGLRSDVRGFVTRQPSFGFARESLNPNVTVFPAGGALFSIEASGGINFYFGR